MHNFFVLKVKISIGNKITADYYICYKPQTMQTRLIVLLFATCLIACNKTEDKDPNDDGCPDNWISNVSGSISEGNIQVSNGNLVLKAPATAQDAYITSRFSYSPYGGGNTCSYKWYVDFAAFDFPDNTAELSLKFRSSTVDLGTVYISNNSIRTTDFGGLDFNHTLTQPPGPFRVEMENRSDFRAYLRVYLPNDTLIAAKNLFNGGGIYADFVLKKPQSGTASVSIDKLSVYQCNIQDFVVVDDFDCLSFYQ
jgi:hypothetical protein